MSNTITQDSAEDQEHARNWLMEMLVDHIDDGAYLLEPQQIDWILEQHPNITADEALDRYQWLASHIWNDPRRLDEIDDLDYMLDEAWVMCHLTYGLDPYIQDVRLLG